MSTEAHLAIQQLLVDFVYAADEGELSDVVATFAEDGVWEMASGTWTGRAAIASGLAGFREKGASGPGTGNRHILSNLRIRITSEDTAQARSVFELVGSGTELRVKAMGTYQDQLVCQGGEWRIARRVVGR